MEMGLSTQQGTVLSFDGSLAVKLFLWAGRNQGAAWLFAGVSLGSGSHECKLLKTLQRAKF
jgi:hypothetical protein